ncbi:MAG TPA: aconitate hydratase, partial [Anaerolinea sp.]|nr:aconitate hydratase [Anaerolinea sp.]
MANDFLHTLNTLDTSEGKYEFYQLDRLNDSAQTNLPRLPYAIRILLEGLLRNCDGKKVTAQSVLDLASWSPQAGQRQPMQFFPGRVVLQDFTGVPVMNDLAAMRSALVGLNGSPDQINPVVP